MCSHFLHRLLTLAALFAVGCASDKTVVANISEPEPFTLSLAAGNFVTATDLAGLYGPTDAMFLYIATDRRSDNMPNPAPQRLGVVIPVDDNAVEPINTTSIGGVEFRDVSLNIDCNHFTGAATWISRPPNWHFTVDATCNDDSAVHVHADCRGNL